MKRGRRLGRRGARRRASAAGRALGSWVRLLAVGLHLLSGWPPAHVCGSLQRTGVEDSCWPLPSPGGCACA